MTTPTPNTVRSSAPSCFRSLCVGSSVSRMDCSIVLVRHRFIRDSSRSAEVLPHQDEPALEPRHLRHFSQNPSKGASNVSFRPQDDRWARPRWPRWHDEVEKRNTNALIPYGSSCNTGTKRRKIDYVAWAALLLCQQHRRGRATGTACAGPPPSAVPSDPHLQSSV